MRRWLCLLLVSGAALAQAQVKTAPPLGRLFSTPEQRAELDARRSSADQPAPTVLPLAAHPAPAPLPPPVELNGLVQRSSGRSTVWLNDNMQQEPYNRMAPGQAGTLTLQLSNGQSVLLKPGQRYDPVRQQVIEAPGGQP